MYDILQLNDMLVPELLDIAEELKIDNPKKLDKQGLIYKILDKQAVMSSQQKGNPNEKPKRKRIVKASTANTTEEAVVEESGPDEVPDNKSKIAKKVAPRKEAPAKEAPKKTPRKKSDDQQELDLNEDDQQDQQDQQPQMQMQNNQGGQEESAPVDNMQEKPTTQVNKFFPPRREQTFNIEFDGIILAEGVL